MGPDGFKQSSLLWNKHSELDRRLQTIITGAKMAQDDAKIAQDGAKIAKDEAKITQDGAKIAQNGSG